MKVLDLLRNHNWNTQALISDRIDEPTLGGFHGFHVLIQAINGFSLDKTTIHPSRDDAYVHAYRVLGWHEDAAALENRR